MAADGRNGRDGSTRVGGAWVSGTRVGGAPGPESPAWQIPRMTGRR